MEYKNFLKVILGIKKVEEESRELYLKFGISLEFMSDKYSKIVEELLREIYGDDGYDWIEWFAYESDYGEKNWSSRPLYKTDENGNHVKIREAGEGDNAGAHDENGNPICYSVESLWEYLEANCKKIK